MSVNVLLRWWLVVSAAAAGSLLTYEFAPVLLPAALVAAGFGGVSWGMVRLARKLERARGAARR